MKKRQNVAFLEDKIANLENQLKRAVADYQNLEKRISDGRSQAATWVAAELVKKLLPILDNLDQAVAGATDAEAESSWLKGVMISIKQLRQVLSEEGLVEVDTSGKFDPVLHEAVDVKIGEDDQILEVVQRGYLLQGNLLRPAKVVVGKSQIDKVSQEAKEESTEAGDFA